MLILSVEEERIKEEAPQGDSDHPPPFDPLPREGIRDCCFQRLHEQCNILLFHAAFHFQRCGGGGHDASREVGEG